jgi:hypothetical protein
MKHFRSITTEAPPSPSANGRDNEEAKRLLAKINASILRRYLQDRCEAEERSLVAAIDALTLDASGEALSSTPSESDLGESRRARRQREVAQQLETELAETRSMQEALASSRSPRSSPGSAARGGHAEPSPARGNEQSRKIEGATRPASTDTTGTALLRDMHANLVQVNNVKGPKFRKKSLSFPGQEQTLLERFNPFADNDTVDPYVIASLLAYPDSQCNTAFLQDEGAYFVMEGKDRNVLDLKVPANFLDDSAEDAVLQIVLNDFDYGPKDDDLIGWALIDLKRYFIRSSMTETESLATSLPDANGVLKIEVMTLDGLSAGDLLIELQLLLPSETPREMLARLDEDRVGSSSGDSAVVRLTILEGKELCNPDAVTTLAASIPWGFALRVAGTVTLVLLIGSMFMFYFVEEQGWTDTIYVIVCTFTTVGYGDIAAQSESGKILTSFIAFFGLALLSIDFVLVYGFLVAQREIERRQNPDIEPSLHSKLNTRACDEEEGEHHLKFVDLDAVVHLSHGGHGHIDSIAPGMHLSNGSNSVITVPFQLPKVLDNVHVQRVSATLSKFLLVLAAGTIGFRFIERDEEYLQGNDSPWATSFYWASITSATVGYGDVHPHTPAGKWFTIAYILISTAVVAEALGAPTDILLQHMQAKGMDKVLATRIDRVMFQRMDEDGGGSLSRDEYLRAMLINLGLVDEPVVDRLLSQYDTLDTQKTGEVTLADISSHNEEEREEALRSPTNSSTI